VVKLGSVVYRSPGSVKTMMGDGGYFLLVFTVSIKGASGGISGFLAVGETAEIGSGLDLYGGRLLRTIVTLHVIRGLCNEVGEGA